MSAPLTAITAAVVGVIVNLAVFFATHVFWPAGWRRIRGIAAIDWIAVAMAALAMIALFRFKVGVIPVIAVSAARTAAATCDAIAEGAAALGLAARRR